jgi:hypothetical protein
MAAQSTPSFLGRRRKKKEEAQATREIDASDTASASTNPATDSPNAATEPKTGKPGRAKPKAQTGSKGAKGKESGGEGVLQSVQPAAPTVIIHTLRGMATRPELLDQFEMIQPGALEGAAAAMLKGATVSGAHGAADRASLWRVLGMPWVGEGGSAKQAGAMLGAALGEAVSRIEDYRGNGRVTVDMRADAKPLTTQVD